ncbi:hypothetical protein OU798_22820 [Prolixibacteraceae bacterium Z1-6]|uniref:PHP domain-containing protein n=1 Tax=Draconibacterium aestuarii TaxID=2998507 RepID=A0A9X3FHD4_9BACT|nr:hypothetical protein [Prolixibacteraceae bacterium Z1-6]
MALTKTTRTFLKVLKYLLYSILVVVLLLLVVALAVPVWRNLVTYPKLEKEIAEFQKLRKKTHKTTQLNTYRGVMHVHSFWSHDSEGKLSDLIPAAKKNGIDFIFLTDHPHGNIDSFPRGYNDFYDDVLILPGSEKQGFAAWPLQDSVVIDWSIDKDSVLKNIVKNGGIVFYAHTEEPHNWDNPWYHGMEIYNFHTDTKDEKLAPNILNFIVNGKKYRIWALRQMFDTQTPILALWDSLNTQRKIVGYSAVDTHENQNFRARYLNDGRVEWIGPNANPIDTVQVNFRNKWLFHEQDSSGWIFKFMIDTYMEGFDYITNYVFAESLTVESLAHHIKQGHLYTAFKSLGDASGFNYFAKNQNGNTKAIPGDSLAINELNSLHAVSPLPGQFRLILDGETINISDIDKYEYTFTNLNDKGAYRIEVQINLNGKYVPWIYSNPIYIY